MARLFLQFFAAAGIAAAPRDCRKVGRIGRLIDRQPIDGGGAKMLAQRRLVERDFTAGDFLAQRLPHRLEVGVAEKKFGQAAMLAFVGGALLLDFAADKLDGVDADPQIEGAGAAQSRQQLIAQEARDRREQLGGRRMFHRTPSDAKMSRRSSSVSEMRRPIIARSTGSGAPVGPGSAIRRQMSPQRSEPKVRQ